MTGKTSVLVYGAGGHGRVVLDAALRVPALRVVGVLDDDASRCGERVLGVEILGNALILSESKYRSCHVVVAIGDPAAREAAAARVVASGLGFVAVVHPTAFLGHGASIGEGAMILPMAVVHTEATVCPHAIINTGAIVEHDCVVGEFSHISPGVCLGGAVHVGRAAHVGIGACVLPGVRIGEAAVVGAGAAVVDDVAPHTIVVGVPARPLLKEAP